MIRSISDNLCTEAEPYPRDPKRLRHLVIKPIEPEDHHTTDLNLDFQLLRKIIMKPLMSPQREKYQRPRRNITR